MAGATKALPTSEATGCHNSSPTMKPSSVATSVITAMISMRTFWRMATTMTIVMVSTVSGTSS